MLTWLGSKHLGVYPLLLDETCWFLAVDFDKKTWKEDAAAFRATCRELDVPAALERSRSGNGAHIWIFFERPIPAGACATAGLSDPDAYDGTASPAGAGFL